MKRYSKKKRIVSFLLVLALMFVTLGSISVSAASNDITSPDGSGKSRVVATIQPAVFSVTVPYVLPITVDKNQNVYTADNVAITNNSNGPVKVAGAQLTTNDGWELVENGTDYNAVPVNSKKFNMEMQGAAVPTSGTINISLFDSIGGNNSIKVDYDADVAVQSEVLNGENIANILVTIEWDSVEITSATVSKSALNTFAKTVTTFQRTQERLNIDDVKAMSSANGLRSATTMSGVTRIDDGTTDKSIYAWSDADGNGYWWTDAMIAYLPEVCTSLFSGCSNLKSLDLSEFSTSKVTNMRYMFTGCSGLTSLDLTSFDTSKVTTMREMFEGCNSLTELDISSFNTSNVTDMMWIFANCRNLDSLDLGNFNTSNVVNMLGMFYNCNSLTSLDLSSFDTSKVTTMEQMFTGCENLISLDVSSFDTHNVTNMLCMFGSVPTNTNGCPSLSSLNLSNFDTSNVTSMYRMFSNCRNLTSLDVSNFDTSKVTNMDEMFYCCSGLTSLDLTSFDTSNVTSMGGMFSNCKYLTSLDLGGFDTSKVTDMGHMFYFCSKLSDIYVSDFKTDNVTSSNFMFAYCTSLVGQNGTKYNSSHTDKTYARIDTAETPGYFTYKAKAA